MTREILSEHHNAQSKLNKARELYKTMRLRAYPKAQTIDDLPKATGTGRKVEELALVLEDTAAQIKALEATVSLTRPVVLAWTQIITDPEARAIAQLRVLCGLPWERVAYITGKSQDAVEKTYRRLMEGL